MSEYYKYEIKNLNLNYNRNLAIEYAKKYALKPNTWEYPYFEDNDCANFISQVLRAGGMPQEGTSWDKLESWFCRTTSTKDLNNISITWRAARYFRRYWGNENGFGLNKATIYIESTAEKVLYNFNEIYKFLKIGDVVQYGNANNKFPYHTQVIVNKGYNWLLGLNDLFMAQHTENGINISFYDYLSKFYDKDIKPVYIYKMKAD
ncbi:amidase domain-containing protein [Clostridium haemolyticum]|uniref:Putative amidase domain-containing protein n=1 Tax=Clostridium haemolyticum NCTC 9693 TaxID=1443114 RepID=A0ABR4TEL0_CLOHA|nr:amidase domain-containing protein [Clostridium haemolyticum]KEI15996.1 hypothetical protein Z960_11190 [Clostridium haemolyticum NCTC 9693]KGN04610.1 hypothetical protein Z961_02005 [Clostridium haemolyticum NCTC 8350]OOB75929.1 hypothetical protein AXF41_05855 [Clostridium haemolyticum]CAG7839050.1 hypothetical protein CLOHAE12215_00436 [Clostridium haemolyticum]